MTLAQMSQAGSFLILFVIVLRALAIYRLPKITFLVLWEVAALRLHFSLFAFVSSEYTGGLDHLMNPDSSDGDRRCFLSTGRN